MIDKQIPAFPLQDVPYHGGMTLRDYFAGRAMQGYMNDSYDLSADDRAKLAYEQADEMMKARRV